MKWDKEKVLKRLKEIENSIGRRPVKRDNSYLYFLSRKYFGTWNNMIEKAGYIARRCQQISTPNIKSNLFYYFLGLLITDGHIQEDKIGGRYRIILYTSYNEEKELIVELVKRLFKYNPPIRKKKYGFNVKENFEIMINSKELCYLILDKVRIPSGAKSLTIRIPKFILKSKKEQILNFIRGVFDGDGSIVKTKKANYFKIVSGSKEFIIDLKNVFLDLGFDSVLINKDRDKLWTLKINKYNHIKRLYPLIYNKSGGFYYHRKERIWKQYI